MSARKARETDLSMFEFSKSLIHNVTRFIRVEKSLNIVDLDEGY